MLDTLARSRYPKSNNRFRFVRLIENFADWPDHNRVSLPLMSSEIPINISHESDLARETLVRTENLDKDKYHRPNIDPFWDDFISFAANSEEKKTVKKYKYSELLYGYRNFLVHEFREPLHGIEVDQRDNKPFYHTLERKDGRITWEIVFPLGLFEECVRNCLSNLRKYFESQKLNPYLSYDFETLWPRE